MPQQLGKLQIKTEYEAANKFEKGTFSKMSKKIITLVIPPILTASILFFIFYLQNLAPFGSNSLASMDARIQYIDFFAYLKDLLEGRADLSYTFSKTLGGTYIAVFSYYLSSPLNLLVVFFDKADLNTFFDLLVFLKLCIAAVTCGIFIRCRFRKISALISILLSVSYALMQYNIAQSSNIMWLDGMYMLPIILLGVHRLFEGNSIKLLSLSIGLSILFNWYSAGINCLFSGIWFIMESLMVFFVQKKGTLLLKQMLLRYFLAAALGIGLSACLFIPTILALMDGKGGIGLNGLSPGLLGNPLTLISNLTLSAKSSRGSVSLYAGSFATIGCIAYFLSEKNEILEKRIHALIVAIVIAIFYFGPLSFVFSLFRPVESYWYRYSYVGSFTIIYLAGCFYSKWKNYRPDDVSKNILKAGIGVMLALLILDYGNSIYPFKYTSLTIFIYLCISCALAISIKYASFRFLRYACIVCLIITATADLGINTYLLAKAYRATNIEKDIAYIQDGSTLVEELKNFDNGFYRINQTSSRHQDDEGLTANYNEAAAYSYASISGYTSAPENIQLDFLDHLGYRTNGFAMNIVNTSILPADSLLGVKYVLADIEIPGLKKVETIPARNGKQVYQNPYCLPLAFIYSGKNGKFDSEPGNPFLYINARYSELMGKPVELFQPIEYCSNGAEYLLQAPLNQSDLLYGNIRSSKELNAKLYINDVFQTGYSKWLAPSVFYIPQDGQKEIRIRLETDHDLDSIQDVQFYKLDLEMLEQISIQISSSAADSISIENGKISGTVTAEKGELLYLSVPYHAQWKILRNGEPVNPLLFGNCLMSIPLTEGMNVIEMTYSIRGLKIGICISVLSLAILAWNLRHYRIKKHAVYHILH